MVIKFIVSFPDLQHIDFIMLVEICILALLFFYSYNFGKLH